MKTIIDLTNKSWYRLFQLIYGSTLIVGILIICFFIFSKYSAKINNDYRLYCGDKTNKNFLAWNDARILITPSDLTSENEFLDRSKEASLICGFKNDFKENGMPFTGFTPMYKVTSENVITGNTITAILYSAIAGGLLILIFTIIKRSFYYVILGSFWPKKQAEESTINERTR
ncbi:hypothetical protein KBC54_02210 [Patescibacteria group bacterium]|nr:hypothetical protein [Patescibacteria group bacterium]